MIQNMVERMMMLCQKKKLIRITIIFKYLLSCGTIIRLAVFNTKVWSWSYEQKAEIYWKAYWFKVGKRKNILMKLYYYKGIFLFSLWVSYSSIFQLFKHKLFKHGQCVWSWLDWMTLFFSPELIQQICIRDLLCFRHSFRHWDQRGE